MKNKQVICFGETLWDVFPDDKRPGGAPMNVAVHLHRYGIDAQIVSRVGKDDLGKSLVEFLKNRGINTQFIQTDKSNPTGVVNVQIAASGDASYDIVYPSAWDFINFPSTISLNSEIETLLVFGSLASRNEVSRNTLIKLLEKADVSLFDVNFRAPHFSQSLVEQLMHRSDIIKLNEHEIKIIGQWLGIGEEDDETICGEIANAYRVPHIILTLGGDGAMVYKNKETYRQSGFSVEVKDTVGSGDSFLAAYLANFMQGASVEDCLRMACATGAFVASSYGAVPDYEISDIRRFMNN
jgi:fructokinase